jgi:glycogen(starch) synthase
MSNSFTYDVFLSHSNNDKSVVRLIAEGLRSRGLRVWFDEWEIQPGEHIPTRIEEGLAQSRVLVLCVSAACDESDWAQLESSSYRFRDPLNKERRFIPLRLDDARVKGTLATFAYIQWNGAGRNALAELIAACRGEAQQSRARQRICMISSEYPPHVLGGLGVHVVHLTGALAEMTMIDLVVPMRDRYTTAPEHVNLRSLSKVEASYDDPISWLHFSKHAADLVIRTSPAPDVLHCHDWMTVLAGIRARKALEIPLVFHVHLPNRTSLCSSVENLGLVYADIVTVNSQAMAEQLRDRVPDKRIVVIPNGVDTAVFRPGDGDVHADPYILFVGRLVEQKGVDTLMRAFVHVRDRFPQISLRIAGTGPCTEAMRRLARCLVIGDHVRFEGWKPAHALAELYRNATVVVVPSNYEPFGMTALEAMACGSPVVASNTGGLREIIRHGQTGCLVQPNDHLDLAQWIMALLHRDSWRRTIGTNAAAFVHDTDTYQWKAIAREFAELYYKLSCTDIDLRPPTESADYADQIRSLAYGLDPSLQHEYSLVSWP